MAGSLKLFLDKVMPPVQNQEFPHPLYLKTPMAVVQAGKSEDMSPNPSSSTNLCFLLGQTKQGLLQLLLQTVGSTPVDFAEVGSGP